MDQTRNIGLSLGADLCWPAAFEDILSRMDLHLGLGEDTVRFATERVTMEPYDLQYTPKYDVVLDRITHWYPLTREWVKKISLMDGTYVLNNPWAIQSFEKHTSYCAMMKLGFPIPKTWMIPPKDPREAEGDIGVTVRRYGKLFDLGKVGEQVGYPAFLKPYDGGGWVGVKRVTDGKSLHAAYDASAERVQHLQAGVKDWDLFVRAIGVGPQVLIVRYDPDAPLHARYVVDFHFLPGDQWMTATRTCRVINAFFNWDFNSCEMLRSGGVLHPIDFANACPDSQVTSLHFHFPWLVKAKVRWSIFAAATGRRMRKTMDWDPYIAIADERGMPFRERLAAYAKIARKRLDEAAFERFCAKHLAHLDEVAWTFFGTPRAKEAVRLKVAALFPGHEVEEFTERFWAAIQRWREEEGRPS